MQRQLGIRSVSRSVDQYISVQICPEKRYNSDSKARTRLLSISLQLFDRPPPPLPVYVHASFVSGHVPPRSNDLARRSTRRRGGSQWQTDDTGSRTQTTKRRRRRRARVHKRLRPSHRTCSHASSSVTVPRASMQRISQCGPVTEEDGPSRLLRFSCRHRRATSDRRAAVRLGMTHNLTGS